MSIIEHPAHYGGDTPYEAIKVVENWCLGFSSGNALKYILRAGKKTKDPTEDLQKAIFYARRAERDDLQYFTEERMTLRRMPVIDPLEVANAHALGPRLIGAVRNIANGCPGAAAEAIEAHLIELANP
jgi:hypothetical protein